MPPPVHLDLSTLDLNNVVADKEAIQKINPQRFEMDQLDAVIYLDNENHVFAGYLDVTEEEFWIRGHMPNAPLMPGVMMCEAAAQLSGWYLSSQGLMRGDFIGFGGLENVRFRAPVHPGDRLVLVGKVLKSHRRQAICNVQGFVGGTMVFHADVLGTPMSREKS